MTPPLRACSQARERLLNLVEALAPEIGFLFEANDRKEPVLLAAYPDPKKAWQGHCPEALEHLLQGGEARIFAAQRPGSPPLAALLGGSLDVVLVGSLPSGGPYFYLSRPMENGLYGEADLAFTQRPSE